MVVVFLRQALRQVEEIHAFYATHTTPTHAHAVIADMRAQIDRLAQFPAYGRPGKRANTRELVLRRHPYIVVYRVELRKERVVILRIQPTRRGS